MYIRPVHAELQVGKLHDFVRAWPLGQFTTAIPHPTIDTLQTTHIPWVLYADEGEFGVLRGHMARANPQAKQIVEAARAAGEAVHELKDDALVLFTSPHNAYVSPRLMTATKKENGKVTPTWVFGAAQVYGRVTAYTTGSEADAFLTQQVDALTRQQEATVPGKPWTVDEAPESYNARLRKAIIGLEIRITKIEGRFKFSQDEADGDWEGIRQGFKAEATAVGDGIVKEMEERGAERPSLVAERAA
ncbi:hypothetical protein VHUM_02100 [Vanrija humicola]|uniref:Transcriptional regulator n=1 Tax=Vanrija humicola TaxID=5417 RepID=A0A7D8YYY0_VANHU|nr:hypothetical protein VHUM_02100 [Vanrija humicola]